MRITILIIISCLVSICLFGQNEESRSLDLGDIIIEGEGEILGDSVRVIENLNSFWEINRMDKFLYKPRLSLREINKPDDLFLSNVFDISIKAGNNNFGCIQSVYSSSKNSISNFSLSLKNKRLQENWNSLEGEFYWLPDFNNFKLITGINYYEFNSEYGDTEIKGANLLLRKRFLSHTESAYQLEFLADLGYYKFEQTLQTAADFDLIANLKGKYPKFESNIKLLFLKQSVSGMIDLDYKNFLVFENIGIWFAIDSVDVYPSISFISSFNPLPGLYLKFKNQPEIGQVSRKNMFEQNHYQKIIMNRLQTKKILNGFAILEYNSFLPLTLFYNISWNQDYLKYVYVQDKLYTNTPMDFLQHLFGFQMSFKYKNFKFIQDIFYSQNDEEIPYLYKLESISTLGFYQEQWYIEAKARYLEKREDETGKKMEDVVLIDLFGRLNLFKNLNLTIETENLLDEDYIQYTGLTKECLQVNIGVEFSF
jgi:outer membrane receptor protein involved in Fe transport